MAFAALRGCGESGFGVLGFIGFIGFRGFGVLGSWDVVLC